MTLTLSVTSGPTVTLDGAVLFQVKLQSSGLMGPAGPSAYDVAVAGGFVGSEAAWLASLVGPTGATGPQGDTGPQGPQGDPGEVEEAPIDGTAYVRKDGAWEPESGDGGGGSAWTEITSATPTGVSAVDFNDVHLTDYNDLQLVFEGVSHNSGGFASLDVNASNNGATFSTLTGLVGNSSNATATFYGSLTIANFRSNAPGAIGGAAPLTADNTAGSRGIGIQFRTPGGIQDIRVSVSSGNFDAGTIRLLGR